MNRLNLEIKRLEEDGQIIPLPSTNPIPETNGGTSTPNGTPSQLQPTTSMSPSLSIPSQITRTAPLPQRSASTTGLGLPLQITSNVGTPTPTARAGQKRKAATAFRRDSSVDEMAADEDSKVYCFCQQVSFGEMVACDNENCEREWFHLPCVGLAKSPQGKWFCDECLAKMGTQKQKQGEKKKLIK
jgi:hypothetical protein